MKINFLLLFSFLLFSSIATAGVLDSIQDTVPIDNPEYIGYRIAIADLSVSPDKSGKTLKVKYKVINTGRENLLFGKKITAPPYLVVNFDHSLVTSGLIDFAQEIRNAVTQSDFNISAGSISKTMDIKIHISAGRHIKVPAIEDTVIPEDFLVTNNKSPENTEEVKTTTKHKTLKPDVDENACSDISIESIQVIKKSKKTVTLEYTIVNHGAGPARMIHDQKKEENNMALKAHFSTKDQLTKGSLAFGGDYLQSGLTDTQGKLYPGEKYTSTIKLNIQKMTTFTPYIILELDPYMAVHECDKTNNKGAIKVGEGRKEK